MFRSEYGYCLLSRRGHAGSGSFLLWPRKPNTNHTVIIWLTCDVPLCGVIPACHPTHHPSPLLFSSPYSTQSRNVAVIPGRGEDCWFTLALGSDRVWTYEANTGTLFYLSRLETYKRLFTFWALSSHTETLEHTNTSLIWIRETIIVETFEVNKWISFAKELGDTLLPFLHQAWSQYSWLLQKRA